ncbi:MAG TPA: hypothetical protein VIT45_09670 [Allosphingosinicella sp.]
MNIDEKRPNRRPKLYLPLALSPRPGETDRAPAHLAHIALPISTDRLRRVAAEMIG